MIKHGITISNNVYLNSGGPKVYSFLMNLTFIAVLTIDGEIVLTLIPGGPRKSERVLEIPLTANFKGP